MLWDHQLRSQGVTSLPTVFTLAQSYHYPPDLPIISFHLRSFTHKLFYLHRVIATSASFCFLILEFLVRGVSIAFYVPFNAHLSWHFSHSHITTQVLFSLPLFYFSLANAFLAVAFFLLYIILRALFSTLQILSQVISSSKLISVSLLKPARASSVFPLNAVR